jgi:hypothetical protein
VCVRACVRAQLEGARNQFVVFPNFQKRTEKQAPSFSWSSDQQQQNNACARTDPT